MYGSILSNNRNYSPEVATAGLVECYSCGALVSRYGKEQHDQFHKSYTYLRDENMSNVSWCDLGDHAFKSGEPGSTTYTGTQFDENGRPVQTTIDACREHNPFRKQFEQAELKALTEKAMGELDPKNR